MLQTSGVCVEHRAYYNTDQFEQKQNEKKIESPVRGHAKFCGRQNLRASKRSLDVDRPLSTV